MYRPKDNFNVPMILLTPTISTSHGVDKKTYPTNGDLIFGSFKSYGGTENVVNGSYSIEDTANVETWFDPRIKSECRIELENGAIYDIINEPEDIELRHQFMKFKVRRVKGNA